MCTTITNATKLTTRVFYLFEKISAIPRESGNEAAIAKYLEDFAISLKSKGVTYQKIEKYDEKAKKNIHDIIITKPATAGYEDLDIVILQSHIDMVCEKISSSTHDFKKDPIKITNENGYLKADGTTLGADDGIGVACMLAILESENISHPKIEALFTSDEEDGMTGALAVEKDILKGRRLINIDTETEGYFYNGSAGGINANIEFTPEFVEVSDKPTFYEISISGLKGGHSGIEINEGRANANKLLARTLNYLTNPRINDNSIDLCIAQFKGGDKKNAITNEASAIIGTDFENDSALRDAVQVCIDTFINEFAASDNGIKIDINVPNLECKKVFSPDTQKKLIESVMLIPNDVITMYYKKDGLVETSCNLGVLKYDENSNKIKLTSFIRSFIESKKQYVVEQMRILADYLGADFSTDADFPNWQPANESDIKDRLERSYREVFKRDAVTQSIHAGLECGYFSKNIPGIDIIACGPTILGAHTPDEKLEVESVGKIVALLVDVLGSMNEEVLLDKGCFSNETEEISKPNICRCIR